MNTHDIKISQYSIYSAVTETNTMTISDVISKFSKFLIP